MYLLYLPSLILAIIVRSLYGNRKKYPENIKKLLGQIYFWYLFPPILFLIMLFCYGLINFFLIGNASAQDISSSEPTNLLTQVETVTNSLLLLGGFIGGTLNIIGLIVGSVKWSKVAHMIKDFNSKS